jgi:hypothetical protein
MAEKKMATKLYQAFPEFSVINFFMHVLFVCLLSRYWVMLCRGNWIVNCSLLECSLIEA